MAPANPDRPTSSADPGAVLRDGLTRRSFLKVAGTVGLAAVSVVMPAALRAKTRAGSLPHWSDPATWGATGVPGPGDTALVSGPVVLDVDANVNGLIIQPGGQLVFDPEQSITLASTQNVVVMGQLVMQPASGGNVHTLRFDGVDESRFVGDGMDVLDTDVGLWVMDEGALAIAGSSKLAWTRCQGSVAKGVSQITLQEDPVGWAVGDELVITPTTSPATSKNYLAYDAALIKAIDGRTITLSIPTAFDHPQVAVGRNQIFTAEVLNLSRNVRIEGTPGRRTHILIHSMQPQTVRYASVRYTGPRQPSGGYTLPVIGRYGVHFHHCMDGSRGSVVEGVVVRDSGNHAFVPHDSNGVAFRDCVSHNTYEEAYWVDPRSSMDMLAMPSDDLLYERCVASLVQTDPSFRGFRLAGFFLGTGAGSIVRDCVSVGVQGNSYASGFIWPEGSQGVWTAEDCVSHNNKVHGIFVWQNNTSRQVISRFTGYHNCGAGISHGAYRNGFRYEDCILFGNAATGVDLWTLSKDGPQLQFVHLLIDQNGFGDHCVRTRHHSSSTSTPVLFSDCDLRGQRVAGLGFLSDGTSKPELFDVIGCRFVGNEFWLAKTIPSASLIHVNDPVHGNIILRRFDQRGTLRPSWNARVAPA